MVRRIYINNFKSLLNFEFKPLSLNLLIGQNNAGKTNLCSAIRFLGLTSFTTLENAALNALGETWNLANVFVETARIEFELECSLPFQGEALDYRYRLEIDAETDAALGRQSLRVVKEELTVSGVEVFQDALLLENRGQHARLLHEEGVIQRRPDAPYYVEVRGPDDATMLSRLFDLENNRRANLFKRSLRSWVYYNLSPDALRSPEAIREHAFLRHDGANLSRVMFALHNEDPRTEKKLVDALRLLEPKLDLFSYRSPDPEHVYIFLEDAAGHRFGTRSMSDGTLRYLAMLYLVHTTSLRPGLASIRPLIMIEEPENGLYVGFLKPLIESIQQNGAEAAQFIFTSHNPYFIDLFDQHIEGIHVIKPGKPSSAITRPDLEKTKLMLSEMALGEMHFHEMLG